VSRYRHKVQMGLFVNPTMTEAQKRGVHVQALQQRNGELEQALQQANLLTLALHTVVEVVG